VKARTSPVAAGRSPDSLVSSGSQQQKAARTPGPDRISFSPPSPRRYLLSKSDPSSNGSGPPLQQLQSIATSVAIFLINNTLATLSIADLATPDPLPGQPRGYLLLALPRFALPCSAFCLHLSKFSPPPPPPQQWCSLEEEPLLCYCSTSIAAFSISDIFAPKLSSLESCVSELTLHPPAAKLPVPPIARTIRVPRRTRAASCLVRLRSSEYQLLHSAIFGNPISVYQDLLCPLPTAQVDIVLFPHSNLVID
jgi:hypothetical protein